MCLNRTCCRANHFFSRTKTNLKPLLTTRVRTYHINTVPSCTCSLSVSFFEMPSTLSPSVARSFFVFVAFVASIFLFQTVQCQPPSVTEEPRCQKDPDFTCDSSQSLFKDEEKISITYAGSTITGVKFGNTFVDFSVRFDISSAEVKIPYRLVVCGCDIPQNTPSNRTILFTNPTNIYVQDGPSLFMVTEMFDENEPLPVKYVNSLPFIYSDRVRALGDDESPSIFDMTFDLLRENDDMSMGFISSSKWTYESTASNFDLSYNRTLLVIGEVSEVSPLARAEWSKIIGLMFKRSERANQLFDKIVADYEDAKRKANQATRRPSTFFNYPSFTKSYVGSDLNRYTWTQPGYGQYIAEFIRDANADYRYNFKGKQNEDNPLPMTDMMNQFSSARVLINADPFDSKTGFRNITIAEIIKKSPDDKVDSDDFTEAMRSLEAVRCGNVWGRRKRVNGDALDFFESAVARPDLLLKDYVKIFHPDVNLGDYQIYYMSQYTLKPADNLTCPHVNIIGPTDDSVVYIDKTLRVGGLNRFEVQDQLEANVYPELAQRGLDVNDIDVQFREPAVKNEERVNFVVRVRTTSANAGDVASSSDVVNAFKDGLTQLESPITVSETGTDRTPKASPQPSTPAAAPSSDPSADPSADPATESSTPTAATPAVGSPGASVPADSTPAPSNAVAVSPEAEESSSSLSTGGIVGLIIGILLVIAVVAIILWVVRKRRAQTEPFDPFTGN